MKSTPLAAARVATAEALVEVLFPEGDVLPAADKEKLLAQVREYTANTPGLGSALNTLLLALDTRFFVTHGSRFASASVAKRRQFVENLTGISGSLLRGISLPFRLAYLLDEKVLERAQAKASVRVPNEVEHQRWAAQISDAEHFAGDEELEADVVIVGTGAGGAAAAYELASKGLAVVLVEEGKYYSRKDFTGRLTEVIPKLYRNHGLTAAIGNNIIPVPIGRNVGGTTTINSGTAMHTPPETLARWRQEEGLSAFTEEEMQPYFDEVKSVIKVQKADPKYVGEIGKVIREGANRIGFVETHELPRNAEGCDGQGLCQFGCPTDAKQSTNVSYIPLALDSGAFLFTGFRATTLIRSGNVIEGLISEGLNSEGNKVRLTIKARRVILAMGSFMTPNFLRQNQIRLPALGNNLTLHPAGAVLGYFPDRVFDHANRIPQGFGVSDWREEGLMFEGGTVPFIGHGLMSPFEGRDYMRFTENYQHTAYFGLMLKETSRGRVRPGPHPDIPLIWYVMNRKDFKLFLKGIGTLARMYLAAGAKEVWIPSLNSVTTITSETELEAFLAGPRKPREFLVTAYHPLGTCRIATNRQGGVVDSNQKVFDYENLYIMDGSTVPGPLGVNPQVTIMALATRSARRLAAELADY